MSIQIGDWDRLCTYHKIRHDDLEDLRAQAGSALEEPLQNGDHDVSERSTDESAVKGHLRDATGEVMPVFIAVLCDPRSQKLL